MDRRNVQSQEGVTLVGAGLPRGQDVADAMIHAPFLVAADGGAAFCMSEQLTPRAVIGDFDSLDPALRDAMDGTRMIRVDEQISTDFEKCLTLIDAPFVIATGFTDGRLDHTMAALSVLARGLGPPTLMIGPEDVIFSAPARLALDLPPGTRLSLFPMAPVTGRSAGLEWPIDGLTLDPMGRIGTSNRVTGPVELAFDTPGCLVIIPRPGLAAALRALTG